MLGQRLRRCPSIKTALGERVYHSGLCSRVPGATSSLMALLRAPGIIV